MNFQAKCATTFDTIKKIGVTSLSKLSKITGNSKSSTQRQLKAIEKRRDEPCAELFETTEGMIWLRRLAIVVVLIFGLKANIGAPTLSLFFSMMNLETYIASSPSSMDKLKHLIIKYLHQYYEILQPILMQLACQVSLVLGADETFFEKFMVLVLMDLSSGFIFVEDLSDNRKADTWEKQSLKVSEGGYKRILCAVTDRGKSLVSWSKNINVRSIPDLFHMQQALVKLFKFSFSRKRKSLTKEEKAIKKLMKSMTQSEISEEWLSLQEKKLAGIEKKHTVINEGQASYRKALQDISTLSHPFYSCTERQNSASIRSQLESRFTDLRAIADRCGIDDKKGRLDYFEKNISTFTDIVDLWWQWIDQDLKSQTNDEGLIKWLVTRLLPMMYWKAQKNKSRSSSKLRKYYDDLYQQGLLALEKDKHSDLYLSETWRKWAKQWVNKFQRSSSSVEGRNAQLKQSHHCLRGFSKEQMMAMTIIHNFIITRDDDTTACERLYGVKPPNFVDWLENKLPNLATPRCRKNKFKTAMGADLFLKMAA